MTVAHSAEQVEILAKVATHVHVFAVTGGNYLTSDDFFATELSAKKARIAQMKKDKR